LVKNGDIITIDIKRAQLNLEVDAVELEKRKKEWVLPPQLHMSSRRGVFKKYTASVQSAHYGATTH